MARTVVSTPYCFSGSGLWFDGIRLQVSTAGTPDGADFENITISDLQPQPKTALWLSGNPVGNKSGVVIAMIEDIAFFHRLAAFWTT